MTNQEQYNEMCNLYEMTVRKMTNKEWTDFITKQFNVSRTTAKNMLHAMLTIYKKESINHENQRN